MISDRIVSMNGATVAVDDEYVVRVTHMGDTGVHQVAEIDLMPGASDSHRSNVIGLAIAAIQADALLSNLERGFVIFWLGAWFMELAIGKTMGDM